MKSRFLGALLAAVLLGTGANATTLATFDLVSVTSDSLSTFLISPFPVMGSGDITLNASGTQLISGSVSLPTYTSTLGFITANDSQVVTQGWNQVLNSTSLSGVTTITSSGSGTQSCTVVVVDLCANVDPLIQGWPNTFIDTVATATIQITSFTDVNNFAGTIVSTAHNPVGGDTVFTYTFTAVPEPGTILLLGAGLLGLAAFPRRA